MYQLKWWRLWLPLVEAFCPSWLHHHHYHYLSSITITIIILFIMITFIDLMMKKVITVDISLYNHLIQYNATLSRISSIMTTISTFLSIHLSHQLIHSFIHNQSIHPSIHPSIYPSIHHIFLMDMNPWATTAEWYLTDRLESGGSDTYSSMLRQVTSPDGCFSRRR